MQVTDLFRVLEFAKLLHERIFVAESDWIGKVEESPQFFCGILQGRTSKQDTKVPRYRCKLLEKTGLSILQTMGPTIQQCKTRQRKGYEDRPKNLFRYSLVDDQGLPPDLGQNINILQDNFVRSNQDIKLCNMFLFEHDCSSLWNELVGIIEFLLSKKGPSFL